MSEPVGNAPRSVNVPGNSHKEREAAAPKKEVAPAEPLQKIVEGKVTARKSPWYKRVGRNLIADDAQSIGDYIVTDVLFPAARLLIYNIVAGGTERALFGPSRLAGRRGEPLRGEPRSLRTRYDQMSDGGAPRKMMTREGRARHDFGEITLDSRAEAVEVVERLVDRIATYGRASVADMYDLLGVTGSYADQRWGWTDLAEADVRQFRGSWLLDLPEAEPLR